MKVLYIDAWTEGDSWTWNNWFTVGEIAKEDFENLKTDQDYATWFHENGFTTSDDLTLCRIEDDQYNVVVCDALNGCPVYAIEYGSEY